MHQLLRDGAVKFSTAGGVIPDRCREAKIEAARVEMQLIGINPAELPGLDRKNGEEIHQGDIRIFQHPIFQVDRDRTAVADLDVLAALVRAAVGKMDRLDVDRSGQGRTRASNCRRRSERSRRGWRCDGAGGS